jgi:hypothetical protein
MAYANKRTILETFRKNHYYPVDMALSGLMNIPNGRSSICGKLLKINCRNIKIILIKNAPTLCRLLHLYIWNKK